MQYTNELLESFFRQNQGQRMDFICLAIRRKADVDRWVYICCTINDKSSNHHYQEGATKVGIIQDVVSVA